MSNGQTNGRCVDVGRRAARLLVAWSLLALTACLGTTPVQETPPVLETGTDAQSVPEQALTPSQRIRSAIQLLQTGEQESARKQLNLALQDKPSLRIAKHLLAQLDADPVAYLGRQHFDYRVAAGDSLSVIAERFLGDALKFVILARYNGIANPGELEAGQLLKIPGPKRAGPAVSEEQQSVGSLPETGGSDPPAPTAGPATAPPPATESQARSDSLEKISSGADERRSVDEPGGEAEAADEKTASQGLYRQGVALLEQGELAEAYNAFTEAREYDPDDPAIASAQIGARDKLIDSYHRQALQLFRKHELTKAIEYWDKILQLDPQHNLALGYRARAVELNSRLEEIVQ